MKLKEINNKVESRIKELIREFKLYPDKFLTEEDIRAYFYHLLLGDFGELKETKDDGKSILMHNEIRWYGISGKLKFRSDIVLFNVSTLETKNKVNFKLPSKAYSFDEPYVLIEIKLRRNKKGSDNKFIKQIVKDRDKIEKIRNDIALPFYSYLLIFDKKNLQTFEPQDDRFYKEFYTSSV